VNEVPAPKTVADFKEMLDEIYKRGGSPEIVIVWDPVREKFVTINFTSGKAVIVDEEPLKEWAYYWVRVEAFEDWEPAQWTGESFCFIGENNDLTDLDDVEIGDEIIHPEDK
jgi:hypothetical protein